jgi:hypothetical protein
MAHCKPQSIVFWIMAVLFAAAAFLATNAWAQESTQPAALRWRLKSDDPLKVAFVQTLTTVSTVGGRAVRMDIEMGADWLWNVEQVSDEGSYTILQKLSRLRLKLTRSDGSPPIEYDSGSSERPRGAARNVAESVAPLLGTSARLTMTARGEIVQVKLLPEAEAALQEMRDAGQVFTLFSADGLTDVLRQALPMLPADPIAAGQNWDSTNKALLSLGAVAQTSQFTYRGLEDKDGEQLARIDVTSQVAVQPKVETPEAPAVKVEEQKMNGTLWFDTVAGRFRSGLLEQQLVTSSPYRDEKITVRMTSVLQFTVNVVDESSDGR